VSARCGAGAASRDEHTYVQRRASARHRLWASVSLGAEHRRVDHERAPRLRVQRVPEPGELVKGWVVRKGATRGGHHRRSCRPLGRGRRHGCRHGRCTLRGGYCILHTARGATTALGWGKHRFGRLSYRLPCLVAGDRLIGRGHGCGRRGGRCRILHTARGATTALGWGKHRFGRLSYRLPCLVAGGRLIAHVRGAAAAHFGGQRGWRRVCRTSVLRSRRGDRPVPPVASSARWHHCGQGWGVGGGRSRPALAAWRGRRGLILGGGCGRAAPPWSRCACRSVRRVQLEFYRERLVVARAHR